VLSRVKRTVLGSVALAAVAVLVMPGSAFASTGTATITGGSLSMNAPASVEFTAILDGTDQHVQAPQALDVLDNTGSAAGWNVTLTSTTFTNGSFTLANSAVSRLAMLPSAVACDANVTCTLADNVVGQSPVSIPADVTAPTAVKILNASTGTGMSGQTLTDSMDLAIPANAHAGTYTSTWTYSVVSAP
jgi:hypothetical protein